jgi:hypothetical protein
MRRAGRNVDDPASHRVARERAQERVAQRRRSNGVHGHRRFDLAIVDPAHATHRPGHRGIVDERDCARRGKRELGENRLDDRGDARRMRKVAFDEAIALADERRIAAAADADHAMAAGEQRLGQRGAEAAGNSGNDDGVHAISLE